MTEDVQFYERKEEGKRDKHENDIVDGDFNAQEEGCKSLYLSVSDMGEQGGTNEKNGTSLISDALAYNVSGLACFLHVALKGIHMNDWTCFTINTENKCPCALRNTNNNILHGNIQNNNNRHTRDDAVAGADRETLE